MKLGTYALIAVLTLLAFPGNPHAGKHSPISVDLEISRPPLLGEIFEIRCTVKSTIAVDSVIVNIDLPKGAVKVAGQDRWWGPLEEGKEVILKMEARFTDPGNWGISARASRRFDPRRSWGDVTFVYLHIGQAESHFGYERPPDFYKGKMIRRSNLPPPSSPREPGRSLREGRQVPSPEKRNADEGGDLTPQSTVTVYGYCTYFDQDGNEQPQRYVKVSFWDYDEVGPNDPLGHTYADGSGFWQADLSNDDSDDEGTVDLYIEVNPDNQDMDPSSYIRVETYGGSPYSWSTEEDPRMDIPNDQYDFGTYTIPDGGDNEGAMWVFQTLIDGWIYPLTDPGSCIARWEDYGMQGPMYVRGEYVYLQGTDKYWPDVIIHEEGHNFMYNVYGNWMPYNTCPQDYSIYRQHNTTCAWLEGWADFFPLAVSDDPVFDYLMFHEDYELPDWDTPGWFIGDAVIGRVTAALWDIYDDVDDGYDLAGYGFDLIWDIMNGDGHDNFHEFWNDWKFYHPTHFPVASIYQNTIDYDSPPSLFGLPYVTLCHDEPELHAIDLCWYAEDDESAPEELAYSVVSVSDPNVNVVIDQDRFVDIYPAPGWTGSCDATMAANDLVKTDTDWFTIYVLAGPSSGPYDCVASEDRVDGIELTWSWTGTDQTGVSIKRDGDQVFEGTDSEQTSWLDTSCDPGTYTYTICGLKDGCEGPSCNATGTRLIPVLLTIDANYIGFAYPDGLPDTDGNEIQVTVDGNAYTTPATVQLIKDATVQVSVDEYAILHKYGLHFGSGPFESWSDDGDATHYVTVSADMSLTVVFDPDVINTRGCCDIACAVNDWADEGDKVEVHPGDHYLDEATGDMPTIIRGISLVSEEGAATTHIYHSGNTAAVLCRDAASFRIGEEGKGFTFWSPLEFVDACVDARNCSDFVIEGNEFHGAEYSHDPYELSCIFLDGCTSAAIEGNTFLRGFYGLRCMYSNGVSLIDNTFQTSPGSQMFKATATLYSDNLTIQGNVVKSVIGMSLYQATNALVGGTLETGNKFINCSDPLGCHPSYPSDVRIDAECNYWGAMTWDEISALVIGDGKERIDFVPWANSDLTETNVPFDPDLTTVTVPENVSLCPQGDLHELLAEVSILDSQGNPIPAMWCDDVLVLWIGINGRFPYQCDGKDLFEAEKTDANGWAAADWTRTGGCGSIYIPAIAGVNLGMPVSGFITSPDINGDGICNSIDFVIFASIYGTTEFCGDFTFDGKVDMSDFALFASHYGHQCPATLAGEPIVDADGAFGTGESAVTSLIFRDDDHRVDTPTLDFGLSIDPLRTPSVVSIEALISYDRSAAQPVAWAGDGLHFLRIETLAGDHSLRRFVRVVAMVDKGLQTSATGGLAGIVKFSPDTDMGSVRPRLEMLSGTDSEGDLIDLAGKIVNLGGDDAVSRETHLLETVLEITPNPSSDVITVRFGAPASLGSVLSLHLYNVQGRLVSDVYEGSNDGVLRSAQVGNQGAHAVTAPGVYFTRLYIDGRVIAAEKVVVLN